MAGLTPWRAMWLVDCAADTYAVVCSRPNFYYFEAQVTTLNSTGNDIFIGIANSTFPVNNPVNINNPPPGPSAYNAVFVMFDVSSVGQTMWPSGGSNNVMSWANGDVVGVAVDTVAQKVWWRNATISPNTWRGADANPANPTTNTNGYSFASAGIGGAGTHVYAFAGCAYDGVHTFAGVNTVLNFGGSTFAAALPQSAIAWGAATTLNPSDAGTQAVLSNGNLTLADVSGGVGTLNGTTQYSTAVRSTTFQTVP